MSSSVPGLFGSIVSRCIEPGSNVSPWSAVTTIMVRFQFAERLSASTISPIIESSAAYWDRWIS